MANYCSNTLTIKGEGRKEFIQYCSGKKPTFPDDERRGEWVPFTFNALVPVPAEVEVVGFNKSNQIPYEQGEDLPSYRKRTSHIQDGYEWQKAHWGCQDAMDIQMVEHEDEIVILFETRWVPPVKWFETVCTLYPNLSLELIHVEENEGDAGRLTNANGKMEEVYANRFDDKRAYRQIVSYC